MHYIGKNVYILTIQEYLYFIYLYNEMYMKFLHMYEVHIKLIST